MTSEQTYYYIPVLETIMYFMISTVLFFGAGLMMETPRELLFFCAGVMICGFIRKWLE